MTQVLTDHEDIRLWAAARSGNPAMDDNPGTPVLRIVFDQMALNAGENQYGDRPGGIDLVGWDARRDMVKLNPLAAWTDADVERFVEQEQVLLNPLRHDGYASIGCWPCTRPVDIGEDPRAGRWSGRAKTECGLHT